MPSQRPQITLRPDSGEQKQRWEDASKAAGLSLNDFIVDAIEARVNGVELPPPVEVTSPRKGKVTSPKKTKRPRTTMCEHRQPPTSFCKVCD